MPRFILFLLILASIAFAKTLIECRVITKDVKECDPYSTKILPVKKIESEKDNKAFTKVRSLPQQKNSTQVKSEPDFWKSLENRAYHRPNQFEPVSKEIITKKSTLRSSEALKTYIMQLEGYAKEQQFGIYTVEQGDVLSRIAKGFGMTTAELRELNHLKQGAVLHIGQRLKVKSSQEMVDAISSGKYKVKSNDTLGDIAKKFKLSVADISKANKLNPDLPLPTGKILNLPFTYKIGKNRYSMYGTKSLRVTATAYTSHKSQTDDTPFIAAWNNRLIPGMKCIAVSRDLLKIYGIRNGTKVRIAGLPGVYRVMDKMNKRYKRRIDIYMGIDRQRALRWGRRSVNIYWD